MRLGAQRLESRGRKIPSDPESKELLADSQETNVVVPVTVKPVQEQVTLALVVVKIGHAAVAVHEADRTKRDNGELPLELGVLRPESQQFRQSRRAQTHLVQVGQNLLRRHRPAEMNDLSLEIVFPFPLSRKVLGGDVGVYPVVLADFDHLRQVLAVVDGDGVGRTVRYALIAYPCDQRVYPLDQPILIILLTDASLFKQTREFSRRSTCDGQHGSHSATPFLRHLPNWSGILDAY